MLRKVKKALNLLVFFLYNRIIMIFAPVKSDKVVFLSESHQTLDGNLKYVYNALPEKYSKAVHIRGDRRENIRLKEILSIWYDMTTAGTIFLDDFYGLTSAQKVRKNQNIVQLWHGAGAYKKFGYSRQNSGDHIEKVHSGYRKYTIAITSSEAINSCYAEAFRIDVKKVAATGIPRTDLFFDEERKSSIKAHFFEMHPELKGKKIVLFAPTYRGRKVEDADYNFEYADLDLLTKELGEDYAVLTKWHPALKNNINKGKVSPEHCDCVLDFSDYREINELLIVCDILITDYSSVIFDFSLLNKPIVYFVYDKEEYGNSRGLYYDFDEYVFGDVVSEREQLASAIKNENMHNTSREKFHKKFMSACDGNSTMRVIKNVLG